MYIYCVNPEKTQKLHLKKIDIHLVEMWTMKKTLKRTG